MNDLDVAMREMQKEIESVLNKIDYSPIFLKIKEVIQTSIDRNFSEGGRYGDNNKFGGGSKKWKKSKRAMQLDGQTLVDTGQLADSIRVSISQETGIITVEMGSNKPYAFEHQFGVVGKHLVARPFLVIQDEDIEEISYLLADFIKSKLS